MKRKIENMIKLEQLMTPLGIKELDKVNLFIELIRLNLSNERKVDDNEELIEEISEEKISEEVVIINKKIEKKEVKGLEKFDIFMNLWEMRA